MSIVQSKRLFDKAHHLVVSETGLLVQVVGTFFLAGLCLILGELLSYTGEFHDMAAGFESLGALLVVQTFVTTTFGLLAYQKFPCKQQALLTTYWILSGLLGLVGAGLILATEATFVGHGFRGAMWVALISLALLTTGFSFLNAYTLLRARFDPEARKQNRAEQAIIADLMNSLED